MKVSQVNELKHCNKPNFNEKIFNLNAIIKLKKLHRCLVFKHVLLFRANSFNRSRQKQNGEFYPNDHSDGLYIIIRFIFQLKKIIEIFGFASKFSRVLTGLSPVLQACNSFD